MRRYKKPHGRRRKALRRARIRRIKWLREFINLRNIIAHKLIELHTTDKEFPIEALLKNLPEPNNEEQEDIKKAKLRRHSYTWRSYESNKNIK